MPTDPFPQLKFTPPELALLDENSREELATVLLRDPDDPEVYELIDEAEEAIFRYGVYFIFQDVVRPENMVAAAKDFERRLRRLIEAYESAVACYRKLDPLTDGWLRGAMPDEMSRVLGAPHLLPMSETEKHDLMEEILSKDPETRIDALTRQAEMSQKDQEQRRRLREPTYVADAKNLMEMMGYGTEALREERREGATRHRRTETARKALVAELAAAFQGRVNWSARYEPVEDISEEPAGYVEKLLRCVRLILTNAKVECPADKALLDLIPRPLRRPKII